MWTRTHLGIDKIQENTTYTTAKTLALSNRWPQACKKTDKIAQYTPSWSTMILKRSTTLERSVKYSQEGLNRTLRR